MDISLNKKAIVFDEENINYLDIFRGVKHTLDEKVILRLEKSEDDYFDKMDKKRENWF
mgnify:CR=1 FL=1